MNTITSALSQEHDNILKVIEIMMDECDRIEMGKVPDRVFFEKVILFIRKYADGLHHEKEEKILFTAMLDNMENLHCNPIPVMLFEHDEGRQFVKGMEESLLQGNRIKLTEFARGYGELLRAHIFKEEKVLYPMAEGAIDESQKKNIIEKYKDIKAENFFGEDMDQFIDSLQQRK